MNQGGALQGVIRTFPLQVTAGDAPQLVVDQGQELSERFFVSLGPVTQKHRDSAGLFFGHAIRHPGRIMD
jgi:hypothetical protein